MIEHSDGRCVYCLRVAAVVMRDDWVLLQRIPNGMILPGGSVEMLEHSTDALTRSLWESLGIHAHIEKLQWVVENIFDYRGYHVHQTLLIYRTMLWEPIDDARLRKNRMMWWPLFHVRNLPLLPRFLAEKLDCESTSTEHVCVR